MYTCCYMDCFSSYLGGHISLLEGALGRVSGLKDRLMDLLRQLEGWRSKLKGHEPPRVLPDDVEKQLQQLVVSTIYIRSRWPNTLHVHKPQLPKSKLQTKD